MGSTLHTTKVKPKFTTMSKNQNLYDWVFHYNHYTKLWAAYHRDDHKAYFNAEESLHPILRHSNIKVLMRHIADSNGDPELLLCMSASK